MTKARNLDCNMISVEEMHSHFAATIGEVAEEKEDEDKVYAQLKQDCTKIAAERGVTLQAKIVAGHEVETIIRHAREGGYDLLVIGFMGHSRVFGRIWGGTSQN